jgi:hypothetical protein
MLIELEKARTRNNVVRIFREELDGPDVLMAIKFSF